MFGSILLPIDIANRSSWEYALPQAIELATAGSGIVTAMTVVRELKVMFEGVYLEIQLERIVAEAKAKLAEIVSGYGAGVVPVRQDVRVGSIGSQIIAAARDHRADLIVMASHRPEMSDYLIGPNAAHVARHATCSVLVLRRFSEPPP
ncbi:MAG TPA: universal stress protein [Alphaproteobacteria bacterium]|nr:universal stress protein [Alphaproteobacteria bacterium]